MGPPAPTHLGGASRPAAEAAMPSCTATAFRQAMDSPTQTGAAMPRDRPLTRLPRSVLVAWPLAALGIAALGVLFGRPGRSSGLLAVRVNPPIGDGVLLLVLGLAFVSGTVAAIAGASGARKAARGARFVAWLTVAMAVTVAVMSAAVAARLPSHPEVFFDGHQGRIEGDACVGTHLSVTSSVRSDDFDYTVLSLRVTNLASSAVLLSGDAITQFDEATFDGPGFVRLVATGEEHGPQQVEATDGFDPVRVAPGAAVDVEARFWRASATIEEVRLAYGLVPGYGRVQVHQLACPHR